MTFEEVCATVGGPPGDYTDGRSVTYLIWQVGRGEWQEIWAAEDAAFGIDLSDDGRVTRVWITEPHLAYRAPTILDRLRARVGL